MSKVRPATEADIPRLVEMGRNFYATTAYSKWVEMDDGDAAAFLRNLMATDGVLLVAENDGLVGMLAAICVPFYFNKSKLLCQEMFWWVEPEHRKGMVGYRLLDEFIRWCDQRGVDVIYATSQDEMPAVGRLYERSGFIPSERGYVRG